MCYGAYKLEARRQRPGNVDLSSKFGVYRDELAFVDRDGTLVHDCTKCTVVGIVRERALEQRRHENKCVNGSIVRLSLQCRLHDSMLRRASDTSIHLLSIIHLR